MATFTVTVPDSEAERFAHWVMCSTDPEQPRTISVVRADLDRAVAEAQAKQERFMTITNDMGSES